MKLFMIFMWVIIACNCYSQKPETILENLIGQYLKENSAKSDSLKQQTDLRVGTFLTREQLKNKRTGTIDSERGELTSKESLISYDIGFSAGAHMNEYRKSECSWYSENIYNGYKISTGLIDSIDKKQLIITVWGNLKSAFSFPANFWTIIKDENDIKTMLEIAFSYRPK